MLPGKFSLEKIPQKISANDVPGKPLVNEQEISGLDWEMLVLSLPFSAQQIGTKYALDFF